MKKQVMQEVKVCDVCGTDKMVFRGCRRCDKDFCYDHGKTHSIDYNHGVHFSGSGDISFCVSCDDEIASNTQDKFYPILIAYRKIRALRNEYESIYKDIDGRIKTAEALCAKLYEELR